MFYHAKTPSAQRKILSYLSEVRVPFDFAHVKLCVFARVISFLIAESETQAKISNAFR